jgi:putative DNA primase/helicase
MIANNLSTSIENFKSFMAEHGHFPPEIIIHQPGDKPYRYNVNGKRDKSGWYVLYDDPPAGAFGDWRGETFKWSGVAQNTMTRAEREAFQRRMQEAQEARRKAQEEAQAKAAQKARSIWAKAVPASPEHSYLQRKGLPTIGDIRQYGKALVVPVRAFDGALHSLQFIGADGQKRFLTDGKVQGHCAWIKGQGKTLVCEGWATGASLHMATGFNVVCAFNAGNMEPVVEALLQVKPGVEVVVCADDDRWNETGNVGIQKAQEVALKHNLKMVAPSFKKDVSSRPTDFDDLRRLEGVEAVKAQVEAAETPRESSQDETWPEPVPLDEYGELPSLDSGHIFGGPVGRFIEALARTSETPNELPAGLVLGVIAASCQGKFRVETNVGHTEPVNLYLAVSLDSGNRKSSVLNAATAPLNRYERHLREQMAGEIQRAKGHRDLQEARMKALRNRYAKAVAAEIMDQAQKEISQLEATLVDVPTTPQLWCQDATPEVLPVLMAENKERMALISSEGGIFETFGGRYQKFANLDMVLQGHSGDPVRINRIGRDPIMMENPCLTICVSPQPEVLRVMKGLPGFWDRGFINRILVFLPPSPLGFRNLRGTTMPIGIDEEYSEIVTRLLSIKTQDGHGPYILRLEPQAFQAWREFSLVIEGLMREGESMEFCKGWASKLPGAAGRIAGLLHCLDVPQPWTHRISAHTMERALDLAAVFLAHARAVFALMGADASIEGARRVFKWIDRERPHVFTKRDCHYAMKSAFPRVSDLEPALSVLEERMYIKSQTLKTGGRPSVSYQVNPHIEKGWHHEVA